MNNQRKGEKFFAKTIVAAIAFALALATLMACEETNKQNSFTDARDGKKYKIVKIGTQTWMAENLNYEAGDSECYDNKPENCKKYGRLYYWETAMKDCPQGWHLPSNDEWDILLKFVDPAWISNSYKGNISGKKLKAASDWNDDEGKSGNGTDEYGFTALPGGIFPPEGGSHFAGDYGYWWSSSEESAHFAYLIRMGRGNECVHLERDYKSSTSYSVRCIQDSKN